MRPVLAIASGLLLAQSAQAQWTTDNLSDDRRELVAASAGDLAVFVGGKGAANSTSDVVDIYDASTETFTATTLSSPRRSHAAAGEGNLIMIGGGRNTALTGDIDILDVTTGVWTFDTLAVPRANLAAVGVGGKILFAGGRSTAGRSDVVEIYDVATGTWTQDTLSQPRAGLVGVAAGGRAVFAGGLQVNNQRSRRVDIYDPVTGTWTDLDLPVGRNLHAGAGVADFAIFACGEGSGANTANVVNVLTGTVTTQVLSVGRISPSGTSVGGRALIAGGNTGGFLGQPVDQIDIFDAASGTWSVDELQSGRSEMGATTVRNRAMFGGGFSFSRSTLVEILGPVLGELSCSPAVDNSSGQGASLYAVGSNVVADNNLQLFARNLPTDQFGYFITSMTAANIPMAGGSQGTLCMAGTTGRFVDQIQNSGGEGIFGITVDVNDLPAPAGPAILAGDTWLFQAWFRDNNPGPVSNFTESIAVTFE